MAAGSALIELNDVSLRFVNYADKQYSLKRAVLDMVLRRESPAPSAVAHNASKENRATPAAASGISNIRPITSRRSGCGIFPAWGNGRHNISRCGRWERAMRSWRAMWECKEDSR